MHAILDVPYHKNMDVQELKNRIRIRLKEMPVISSPLGEIKVDTVIGEGGTALVYSSSFLGSSAIKIIAEEITDPPSSRYKRILDEYRGLLKLVRTGAIVSLYHYGVLNLPDAFVPFIAMERCPKTLHDVYKNNPLQNRGEFETLLTILLNDLEVIHNAGIIHRDIKPKNILVRENDEIVLADFGIAWFEPEVYDRLARTERGERLGNLGFSAPEQVRREYYDQPQPNMDLYALGQTLYFLVTGQVVQGAGYRQLRDFSPDLEFFDPLISKLIQQQPDQRLQSVSEVRNYLSRLKEREKGLDEQRREYSRYVEMHERMKLQIEEFNRRLSKAMPGSSGRKYTRVTDRNEIKRVMRTVCENCETYNLHWKTEISNWKAYPFEELDEETYLLDDLECKIRELWIHRNPTDERQYVALHLAAMPPFLLYGPSDSDREEVGYFRGQYINRSLIDDGHIVINDEVVEIDQPETRMRYLKDEFMFLAPHMSVIFNRGTSLVWKVCQAIKEEGKIQESLLKPLDNLEREYWMSMFD